MFIVGVDNLKSRIHSLIAGQTGIRFSNTLEGRFYEELGSEKRQIRYKQGRPIHEWVRIGNRPAESLDCLVYSLAVRNLVFGDPGKREIELRQKQKQQTHPGPGNSNKSARIGCPDKTGLLKVNPLVGLPYVNLKKGISTL